MIENSNLQLNTKIPNVYQVIKEGEIILIQPIRFGKFPATPLIKIRYQNMQTQEKSRDPNHISTLQTAKCSSKLRSNR